MNIIILSSCRWSDMLQRPHHMARALAKLGNTVTFIEPAYRQVSMNKSDISETDILEINIKETKNIDGVYIYSPIQAINNIPVSTISYQLICQFLLPKNSENDNVIITYLPAYIHVITALDSAKYSLVYDCVDDHSDLTYSYWSSKNDIENEAILMDKADIILTTSSSLFLDKSIGRDNVYLSKNAVNTEDFILSSKDTEPDDIKNIPGPRIVYMGAIDKWFNTELFYKVIESNPDKSFILIGPQNGTIINKTYQNLYLLGPKKHAELKNYLKYMDVGIIPFRDDIDLIINCDPIKLYEYLTCGLPVVSTGLPDLCINNGFIATSNNHFEFSNSINEFLNVELDMQAINTFIANNTWSKRAKDLLSILNENKTNQAHKNEVINDMQQNWGTFLAENENPIIKSLYSLTYAESNIEKFLEDSKTAYEVKGDMFTLKQYVIALYLNNRIEDACNIVLTNPFVNDVNKAELKLQMNRGIDVLINIHLFYCIRKLELVLDLINYLPTNSEIYQLELANYYVEVGRIEDALNIYNNFRDVSMSENSPLFHTNLKAMLTRLGLHSDAQKSHFISIQLIDKLLNKDDRFTNWKNLFTETQVCDNCGEVNSTLVITRPDNQNIVSCTNCGLAYLEKIPVSSKLHKLYDFGYYTHSQVAGYNNDYFNEDKGYMFKPRLNWINNTTKTNKEKTILDIGCANGEFLSYAKESGWKTYGIEISSESYSIAKKLGIEVYNDELQNVKFPDNYFDCITLWDVVEHYISPKRELKEIFRILKPNGKLFISTPNHRKGIFNGENWFGYNASYEHLFYFEPSTLIDMLTSIGFKIDDSFTHDAGDWNFTNVRSVGHVLLLSARK
ncbi:methyltransferase domain-containing protein [Caldibacillus lycopersici]|uniref:Methyltransferase domain-containing protein n=1 Tax=Perspicuibacillus lycopersici TaxID=1325689 RepID=A0AAE3IT50_9BACI|nr:methyltransferase domain-containing protein [Perspicuibacillus lycopersici]MCU9612979.1 methyltransferase domain-containing protein [Perspicuibacillus lycopersici]